MRILITGAGGMLGRDVVRAVGDAGHEPVALARAELDIADGEAVNAAVVSARPDAVINCAAWTDVDGAESAEGDALAVNGHGRRARGGGSGRTRCVDGPCLERLRVRRGSA